MNTLWLDFETFSATSLNNGTYVYAENAEVMLAAWAIDDDRPDVWDRTAGEPIPYDLEEALRDPGVEVVAHNAMFDRSVMRLQMPDLCPPIERWRCSMVKAMAHSLPGSLDKIGEILGLPEGEKKLKEGRELVRLFCMPPGKHLKRGRATRETHPVEWARFKAYAAGDITAMRSIYRKLPSWNYGATELALWHLDQHINDRGVMIDQDLCRAAITMAEAEKLALAARAHAMTDGEVESLTKRDKLLAYLLKAHGVDLPDMQASTLERRIQDPALPWALRELLAMRLQASMGSTSKYKAALKAMNADGRVRGIIQFDGAGRTRRDAGRVVQPQNMFRPPEYVTEEWEPAIQGIKDGSASLIYPNIMELTAATARGMLVPAPGKKFVVADLANIEGRDAAWLAGERWKLQAFREYDAGTGPDLYKMAYAKSFGVPADSVTKPQRQIGKVMELFLQYEGGVGAFVTGALTYGIDLDAMAEQVLPGLPAEVYADALSFMEWKKKQALVAHLKASRYLTAEFTETEYESAVRKMSTEDYAAVVKTALYDLSEKTFIACDGLKRLWRSAHPAIATLWREMRDAVVYAINNPGQTFPCRKFKMRRDGNWLRIGLPSGRALCYPSPQIDKDGSISYLGVNQYSRKWGRIKTYGGKMFENACQSLARDVMFDNIPAIEAAGYGVTIRVHDEVVTETPDTDEFNVQRLSALLSANPPWALDMPLAAAGFEGPRYKKE